MIAETTMIVSSILLTNATRGFLNTTDACNSICYTPNIIHITASMETTKVSQLNFSDLYLGHPTLEDRFSDVPGASANPLPAGPLLRDDLDRLTVVCRDTLEVTPSSKEFKVAYDGEIYRVSVIPSMGGNVFVLRRITRSVQTLAELGIPQAYIRHLMTRDLSGLLVVSGATKAGKTTTACALLKDRLTAYGGVAVTGEDPIEMPLEGSYGQGVVFQTTAPRGQTAFSETFQRLTRYGAHTILIDEIRDQETAAELLQASISGHLIITTMLADSVIQTITKLHALAEGKLAPGSARALLADGLVGVLHQNMTRGVRPKLDVEFLFFRNAPVSRTVLRNGRYEQLASDIKQQSAAMIAESAILHRMMET